MNTLASGQWHLLDLKINTKLTASLFEEVTITPCDAFSSKAELLPQAAKTLLTEKR